MIILGIREKNGNDYIIGGVRGNLLDAYVKIVREINVRGGNLNRIQELELHQKVLDSKNYGRKQFIPLADTQQVFWIAVTDEIK